MPRSHLIKFSFIVPISRDFEFVERLLKSLTNQSYPVNKLEVILVGQPLPFHGIKKYPQVISVHSLKKGANFARSIGSSIASGDFLFFIDDDCFIEDFLLLKKWSSVIEKNPHFQIFGGTYSFLDSSFLDNSYNLMTYFWQLGGSFQHPNLLGGHLLVHRSVFRKVQFNEKMIYGGTESEFLQKSRENGNKAFLAISLPLNHKPNLNLFTFLKKAYRQGLAKEKHDQIVPFKNYLRIILFFIKNPRHVIFCPYIFLFWLLGRLAIIHFKFLLFSKNTK